MTLSPSSAPRPLGRYALALGRVPGRGLRCWGAGAGPMVYRWDALLEGGGGAADGGGGGGEEAREASVLWGHARDVHALALVARRGDGRARVLSTGRDGLLKGWAAASDDGASARRRPSQPRGCSLRRATMFGEDAEALIFLSLAPALRRAGGRALAQPRVVRRGDGRGRRPPRGATPRARARNAKRARARKLRRLARIRGS